MKRVRLLLLGTAALVVILGIAVLLAFNSRVQTWAAHRVLAGHPEWGATLGSVSAGLGNVVVKNLRVVSNGAVLTVPNLEVDLPVIAAGLKDRVTITRLVAKGWTLDLTKTVKVGQIFDLLHRSASRPALTVSDFSLLSSARAAEATPATAAQVFQGVFAQLSLPVDLALDGVTLEGEAILPAARGHARISLSGGGLGSGREGRFELAATAALTSLTVSTLETRAVFAVAMDTPRTFTRLGAKADATASGPQFPRGVKLSAEVTATRAATGEEYALALATADKQLVAVQASFPTTARKLTGTWKVDARDAEVAPFALGRPLPPFAAAGEGQFDFDAAFAEVHATGRISGSSDNLATVRSELGALGAVRFTAEFDLTQIADQTRVEHLSAAVSGTKPVATIDSLQTLTYNRATHAVSAADPARELFAVTLQGVPLGWAQPFLGELTVTGGDVRAEFVATASDDGFSLRPKAPLTVADVAVTQAGKPMLRAVDVSLNASVDYTPHGWQVAAAPLTLRTGTTTLLSLEGKAGQLAGANQPLKAAGDFSATLPVLLAQPAAGAAVQLTGGDLSGSFAANLGATQEIQAKLVFKNLIADPKITTEKLPEISADVRADIAAGGQITFNAPVLFERDGRKSDLSLVGTVTPDAKGQTVAGRVSSNHFVVDDVAILASSLAPTPAPESAGAPAKSPDRLPPWAGIKGQIALALKEVVYSGTFTATDIAGMVKLDEGALKLEGMRAGLGKGGNATASGAVTFDAKAAAPYALNASLAVTEFDAAPFFLAVNPGKPATVEGKFNITSRLAGEAAHLGEFATTARGDFQLSSKGGVFRGLPVTVAEKNEAVGKLAAGVALVGSAFDVFKGRKDDSEITSTAKAVSEISKMLAAISYDQLSVALSRDAALNTVLKDFTLISPEMRLTGNGQATHQDGTPLLDEKLAMEFKLGARGHTADLLKYLGKLETQTDQLGYAACTLPLKVGGTLGQPSTAELNTALAGIAVEKSGVKDKASDLLNKLLGK